MATTKTGPVSKNAVTAGDGKKFPVKEKEDGYPKSMAGLATTNGTQQAKSHIMGMRFKASFNRKLSVDASDFKRPTGD